jgi:hypothetical protein
MLINITAEQAEALVDLARGEVHDIERGESTWGTSEDDLSMIEVLTSVM